MQSLRVKPGSALERLLQGRSFTSLVHELAERAEQGHINIPPIPIGEVGIRNPRA